MRATRFLKAFALQLVIILATIAALDVVLFFTLPQRIAEHFPAYREGTYVIDVIGRGYPDGYFEAHPERGFDIKPTATPRTDQIHHMDDYSYPVWANKLGCFDKPVPENLDRFWYLAGDSIAWGHAKFEDLIGSVVEQQKGVTVLQCGVTHSGQRHQFSKFLEISKKLGKYPERVLVFYSPTDTANDYLYPHSSVVDGGLADIRMLNGENEPVDLDPGWFEQVRAEREAAQPSKTTGQPTTFSLSRFLMEYSMTAQLLNAGLYVLEREVPWLGRRIGVLGEEPGLGWQDQYFRYDGKKLYDLHRLTYYQTADGYLEYADYNYADENKAIIKRWRDHARAHGYKLEFVLPHPGPSRAYEDISVKNFYKEVIAYLTALDIKYYDLTRELEEREIETDDLYWEQDIHLSGRGNRIVGKILSDLL